MEGSVVKAVDVTASTEEDEKKVQCFWDDKESETWYGTEWGMYRSFATVEEVVDAVAVLEE